MSKVVDNKIVSLKLDHGDLMKRADEALGALRGLSKGMDSLKGVNFQGATKDLSSIADNTAKADEKMGLLGKTVESVKSRFSILGIAGMTAVSNITNKLINSIHPLQSVKDGFNEYGEKMKAIQVIQSNTGLSGAAGMKRINAALDDLNHYADKTIYSFSDMTSNIGRFTAAGVNVEDASAAIKGFSNLAAATGTNAEETSRAMIQLSQGMSSGVFKLQDWRSFENSGALASKKFQKALIDQAHAMGKSVDQSVSFRDSLTDGWLTADVMLGTLKKFGNDASMLKAAGDAHTFKEALDATKEAMGSSWASFFESLTGGYEQQTKMWTAIQNGVGDVINEFSQGRNRLADNLKEMRFAEQIGRGVGDVWDSLVKILRTVHQAWVDVFPPTTRMQLNNIIIGFNTWAAAMKPSESTLRKIGDVARGVFSVFHILATVIGVVVKAIWALIPKSSALGMGFLDLFAFIGRLVTGFDHMVTGASKVSVIFKTVQWVINALASVIGITMSLIIANIDGIIGVFQKLGSIVLQALKPVIDAIKRFADIVITAAQGNEDSTNILIQAWTKLQTSLKVYIKLLRTL